MNQVSPYHTDSLEYPLQYRTFYHDHDDCPDGKQIPLRHRESGTGWKQRCPKCAQLDKG